MKIEKYWNKDGFIMRNAKQEDMEKYFFEKCIEDEDRYLFLVFDSEGSIIGECVLNEIDFDQGSANFRIGIFHSSQRGKGIGTWMVKSVRDFAFAELKLHCLELSVFSFNLRAQAVYKTAGFKQVGICRNAVLDGDQSADEIEMVLLEDDWKKSKSWQKNFWI